MSTDYTNLVKIGPILVDTPTNLEIQAYIPAGGFEYLIHSMDVVIQTAGAQATGTVVLETSETTPVNICTAAVGTNVARTSIVAKPATIAAGTVSSTMPLQVKYAGTTDASLRCWVYVNMTQNIC